MASYDIRIKRSARKEIENIDLKADRIRVIELIQTLARDARPPGAVKLSGAERYRLRQGRFRILYEVFDDILVVIVVRVADRKDVYRRH